MIPYLLCFPGIFLLFYYCYALVVAPILPNTIAHYVGMAGEFLLDSLRSYHPGLSPETSFPSSRGGLLSR